MTMGAETLRGVLQLHECTHVVIPKALIACEEGPDFYAVEDFKWILEDFRAIGAGNPARQHEEE